VGKGDPEKRYHQGKLYTKQEFRDYYLPHGHEVFQYAWDEAKRDDCKLYTDEEVLSVGQVVPEPEHGNWFRPKKDQYGNDVVCFEKKRPPQPIELPGDGWYCTNAYEQECEPPESYFDDGLPKGNCTDLRGEPCDNLEVPCVNRFDMPCNCTTHGTKDVYGNDVVCKKKKAPPKMDKPGDGWYCVSAVSGEPCRDCKEDPLAVGEKCVNKPVPCNDAFGVSCDCEDIGKEDARGCQKIKRDQITTNGGLW